MYYTTNQTGERRIEGERMSKNPLFFFPTQPILKRQLLFQGSLLLSDISIKLFLYTFLLIWLAFITMSLITDFMVLLEEIHAPIPWHLLDHLTLHLNTTGNAFFWHICKVDGTKVFMACHSLDRLIFKKKRKKGNKENGGEGWPSNSSGSQKISFQYCQNETFGTIFHFFLSQKVLNPHRWNKENEIHGFASLLCHVLT